MKIDIPAGVRTFSRAETFQLKKILKKINEVFEKWAYEEIKLPTFEYFDVHKKALDEDIISRSFKLVDRSSGEILVLRADFTAQIARYFSSLKKKNLPKRYYYTGNIFRFFPPKADNLWEIYQTGIELIGSDRIEADAEVIAVSYNSLKELGIENFQIDINNIRIFTAIKDILNLSENEFSKFMQYIKNREIYNLRKFASEKNIEKKLADFIINIPKYQGEKELILRLKEHLKDYPLLLKPLEELETVYNILDEYELSDKLIIDLGEPREFSYYTGIVFEIFIKDFPKPIGQGGRYDRLISNYNGDFPATGFAFYLLNIWDYMKKQNLFTEKNFKDFFIIDITQDKKTAYMLGKILRKKGYKVGRDIIDRDVEKSIEFAFENRYRKVILIGVDREGKSIYIYSTPKNYEKKEIGEFLKEV